MKKNSVISFLTQAILLCSAFFIHTQPIKNDTPFFCIVIPSYNNAQWYKKNLDSVFCQNYPHYRIIYVDDCSTDNTGNLVNKYVKQIEPNNNIDIIINTKRKGALANLYYAIHSCDNHEIVVTLDGDDWFAHEHVLERLSQEYKKGKLLTYGQYTHPWGGMGCPREIPRDLVERNAYREGPLLASHLRTFYAGLFKQIKLEDLLYEGTFFPMTWDWAMMFPMLEMSGGNFTFIKDILYVYNTKNPINDSKIDGAFQIHLSELIQQKTPYKTIDPIIVTTNQKITIPAHCIVYLEQECQGLNSKQINDFLRGLFATKKNCGTNYVVITKNIQSNESNTIVHALQRLEQTQANISLVAKIKNIITRNNITDKHYTPLYDNMYTFQLGWKPHLNIEHIDALIFSLDRFDYTSYANIDLLTTDLELNHEWSNIFPEYTGLLFVKQ